MVDKHYLNLAELRLKMREGWRDMREAPRNAKWIIGLMPDGPALRVHYADSSGEGEQPPFRGWFRDAGEAGFYGVSDPILWMPVADYGEGGGR